jgi:GDSL-like Lipase/Acylhydrolase family
MRLSLVFLALALLPACSSGSDGPPPAGAAGGGGRASSGEPGSASGGNGGAGGGGAPQGTTTGAGGSAPEPTGPIRYPASARHSPLTKGLIERLTGILTASPFRHDVFAKVGDSNTVNTGFLRCLAGADLKLASHAALEPTRAFFAATLADATRTSYDRTTLAAKVGWTAGAVLSGTPSPLEQEIAAIKPGFAVVMLGTNDTTPQGIEPFCRNLLRVVDASVALGVVPLLTTIPERADSAEAAALVPEMNAVVRAVAQSRQVPWMDLEGALRDLPGYGLISDGIHLNSYVSGGVHACWFDEASLTQGMNRRNLITLEALDRARRFLLEGEAPEPRPSDLVGAGTWEQPLLIDVLPFVDDRDTSRSVTSSAKQYSCTSADEGGPEVVYRLQLSAPTDLRIRVFDDASADIDLQFMADPGGPAHCLSRADKVLDVTAGPGTYWLAADTYAGGGMAKGGPYLLTVVRR